MNIAIIGTGYVGLVTGTCFAESGNNVICVDIDDATARRPNISKAKILLGWEPKVSIEDGLLKTISYLKEKLALDIKTRVLA